MCRALHKRPSHSGPKGPKHSTQLDNHIFVDGTAACNRSANRSMNKKPMPPRHRFLEPIYNVKVGADPPDRRQACETFVFISGKCWWSQSGSNRRPQACKASALPTELWPLLSPPAGEPVLVGREGVEPSTSRLSGVRSNHLSYRPPSPPDDPMGRGRLKASSGAPARSLATTFPG